MAGELGALAPGLGLPDAHHAVAVAGGQRVTAGGEEHLVDGSGVAGKRPRGLAATGIPQAQPAGCVTGREQVARGVEVQGVDAPGVAAQVVQLRAGGGVPDLDGAGVVARGQQAAVRAERQPVDGAPVTGQHVAEPAGVQVPDADGASGVAGHEPAGQEDGGVDRGGVAGQRGHVRSGDGRPHLDHAIGPASGDQFAGRADHHRPDPLGMPGEDVADLAGERVPHPYGAVARAGHQRPRPVRDLVHPPAVAVEGAQR